jgi:hypothetical protein
MVHVIDLRQLTPGEWGACNCTGDLGMTHAASRADKDEKMKLGEAASFLRALDVLPFTRLPNQENEMLRAYILNRKLRLKRVEGLHVIKNIPQNHRCAFQDRGLQRHRGV